MKINIQGEGAFASTLVTLNPGDKFVSESGAMYRSSANVDIDVTKKSRGKGGILGGLKRLLSGENFFFSTYETNDGQPGEVGLAPTHQGEIELIEMDGTTDWMCAGGSYLASSADLEIDTEFQGFIRGAFSGEAPFFLRVSGPGPLLVTAFGRIVTINVKDEIIVDTGHVVAFEESLDYELTKAGSSWIQSWLAGEGVVLRFKGQGKLMVQSHNPNEFGGTLGPMLPTR
ncbi:MAG: TIGR00266 family protein [Planctomycetaceae bacterium]